MGEYLSIGYIINTHGIKGEVKVKPLTDDVKRFKKLEKVLLDNKYIEVVSCKFQKNNVILKLQGIDCMDDAMRCRNKYIKIDRDNAVELEKDEYFIADLIGCQVVDTQEKFIGKIFDVIQTGSNDVYWVKGGEDKEVLVPALKDIVEDIDINNSRVVIKPINEWQG